MQPFLGPLGVDSLPPIEYSSHDTPTRASIGSCAKCGLISSSTTYSPPAVALEARTTRLFASQALMPQPPTISAANICHR